MPGYFLATPLETGQQGGQSLKKHKDYVLM